MPNDLAIWREARATAGWQARRAENAQAAADAANKDVRITQARFLTGLADQAVKDGDVAMDVLLALEAPVWEPAQVSLYRARRMLRELVVLKGHTNPVTSVAVSPDGALIITGSTDKTARVWGAKSFAERHVSDQRCPLIKPLPLGLLLP